MRRFLGVAVVCALFVTPLLASKTVTVNIPETVTVGSTHIAPGEYKLSYEGSGSPVKVTLTRAGSASIVLDARLVPGKNDNVSVTLDTIDGARVLHEIGIKTGSLVFETPNAGNR